MFTNLHREVLDTTMFPDKMFKNTQKYGPKTSSLAKGKKLDILNGKAS